MTKEEMHADLIATQKDANRLNIITQNIALFISEAHGEDRSRFRLDLLKYQTLAQEAEDLIGLIHSRIKESK